MYSYFKNLYGNIVDSKISSVGLDYKCVYKNFH